MGAVMSLAKTMSKSHSTSWPGRTSSRPACAARIFSAMVMGRAMWGFLPLSIQKTARPQRHFVRQARQSGYSASSGVFVTRSEASNLFRALT